MLFGAEYIEQKFISIRTFLLVLLQLIECYITSVMSDSNAMILGDGGSFTEVLLRLRNIALPLSVFVEFLIEW